MVFEMSKAVITDLAKRGGQYNHSARGEMRGLRKDNEFLAA
jgi:hypothetical protein